MPNSIPSAPNCPEMIELIESEMGLDQDGTLYVNGDLYSEGSLYMNSKTGKGLFEVHKKKGSDLPELPELPGPGKIVVLIPVYGEDKIDIEEIRKCPWGESHYHFRGEPM
jgi:hypothetical protein